MYCKNCGQKLEESSHFCNNCGKEIHNEKKESNVKKTIWKNQEEKDLYYKKRKKKVKYIVVSAILLMIAFIVSIVALVFFALDATTKELRGTWSCKNGQEIWEISKDKFRIYENDTPIENEIKGNYSIYSFHSNYENGRSNVEWRLQFRLTDKTISGKHSKTSQTEQVRLIKRGSNTIQVVGDKINTGYTCIKKK